MSEQSPGYTLGLGSFQAINKKMQEIAPTWRREDGERRFLIRRADGVSLVDTLLFWKSAVDPLGVGQMFIYTSQCKDGRLHLLLSRQLLWDSSACQLQKHQQKGCSQVSD